MPIIISTEDVPEQSRARFWREALDELYGANHDLDAKSDLPFHARMSWKTHGPATLFESSGSACGLLRHAGKMSGRLQVVAQIEGSCRVSHGGKTAHLDAGSFTLLPMGERVEFEFEAGYRQLGLVFDASCLADKSPAWRRSSGLSLAGNLGAGGVFLSLLQAMQQHQSSLRGKCCQEAFVAMLNLLTVALEEMDSVAKPATRMANYHKDRVRQFVLSQLSNPDLDISMVANELGISTRYVYHLFSDEDMHLMRWTWAQRLERCRQELIQTATSCRSISSIAFAWGFSDPAHFSRTFRKQFGVSPRELRRLAADDELAHLSNHALPDKSHFSFRQDIH